jgi:sensor c-di-GMP phosphodiesterase-like protein
LLIQSRNLVVQTALVLAGAGLGTVAAWSVAHQLELRASQAELTRYAHHLQDKADTLALEVRTTLSVTIPNDNLPFCSDQELAFMRRIVYDSPHIKDIGRNRDGRLVCTAAVGRLPSPAPVQATKIVIRDMHIFIGLPLLMSPAAKGVVVEYHGASVVLNPYTYDVLDRPPMTETGLIYDRSGQHLYRVFGHEEPLSDAEVIAARPMERSGVVYQPLCSAFYSVCVVAAEPRASMTAGDRTHFAGFLIFGGLFGGFFAISVIFFFSRQRTFQRSLRRAIRKGEISIVYQPIVDLATGSIVGAEALARWRNDSGEDVPPELFVAVAEQKGFIHELTRFMICRSVEEIAGLLLQDGFQVTINITAMDLRDPAFFSNLEGCMNYSGIRPAALGLELTERSTAEQSLVAPALARLKAAGHAVYVDDFGTGYSSLAYLHQLEIDAIKIDRTFTSTVGTEAVTASVVPQILDMARRLELRVVVEGIETQKQADYFRQAGEGSEGILGQGWLFGKPVPAAEFKRLFHARSR